MINNWTLISTGQAIHSFIVLINFYHNYSPYFKIRLKSLRKLYREFFQKPIPLTSWTSESQKLFLALKKSITSSLVLSHYDPDKPTFLKTDWSADGMAWILIQPAKCDKSAEAAEHLDSTGERLFDMDLNGARLKPVSYGSRAFTNTEQKFHSFVGEAASGQWAIGWNRQHLWGCHLYWMCDCKYIEEILEYTGNIAMIQRWAQ